MLWLCLPPSHKPGKGPLAGPFPSRVLHKGACFLMPEAQRTKESAKVWGPFENGAMIDEEAALSFPFKGLLLSFWISNRSLKWSLVHKKNSWFTYPFKNFTPRFLYLSQRNYSSLLTRHPTSDPSADAVISASHIHLLLFIPTVTN